MKRRAAGKCMGLQQKTGRMALNTAALGHVGFMMCETIGCAFRQPVIVPRMGCMCTIYQRLATRSHGRVELHRAINSTAT